jgi:uncharacterized protein DUF4291
MVMLRQIRADFDATSLVVYQAYAAAIAEPALRVGRFVAPFSFGRMTWVKPSYRWLMHRSDWGRKVGQERVLAVRMTRTGFEEALGRAVSTERSVAGADVHVQWDPERSVRGAALNSYSIHIGIGRGLIRTFNDEWILGISDLTPLTHRIAGLLRDGRAAQARRLLPAERAYPLPDHLARRIGADG